MALTGDEYACWVYFLATERGASCPDITFVFGSYHICFRDEEIY